MAASVGDLKGVAIMPRPGGCAVSVHVQPRASRDEVVGAHGAALKVRLTAPPVGGRANDALVSLLAEALDVVPSAVVVTLGHQSRAKVVAVAGLSPDEARARLQGAARGD